MATRSETTPKPTGKKAAFPISKVLFSLVGITSFALVLHAYGLTKLAHDFSAAGWWILPICLTFIPTLLCYSYAWQLVTDAREASSSSSKGWHRRIFFLRMTVISIAWNNMSPFVKVLGEPVKVMMLEKEVGRKYALQSVVVYNVVHLFGTIGAFLVAATLIPLLYTVPHMISVGCLSLVGVFLLIAGLLYALPWLPVKKVQSKRWRFLRASSYWLRWSLQKIKAFYRDHKAALICAVLIEILGRFLEGLTFYTAFQAIGAAIPIRTAAFLDVGRALLDNIFFFIPYQVGTRELGVRFLMKSIFQLPETGFVTATLFYRLVEMSWMIFGYILWMKPKSSVKSSK